MYVALTHDYQIGARGHLKGGLMIVLGIILLLLAYLLPGVPAFIATIGWILIVVGIVLFVLGAVGRPIGGRKHFF